MTPNESRASRVTCWLLAGLMHLMTIGLVAILAGIMLFEEGDFGPPPRSATATVLLCVVVFLGVNLVMPWLLSFDSRLRVWEWRSPSGLHAVTSMYGTLSMVFYLVVIEPAGGRQELLTITVPAVLMPLGYLLSWRALQIGAKFVGRPPRDVSDWTALDHLLGRRRRGRAADGAAAPPE